MAKNKANAPSQKQCLRTLNELKGIDQKGKQGHPWTTEEDSLLLKAFNEGNKIYQLAKLHGRSHGAIKARLIKLEMMEK